MADTTFTLTPPRFYHVAVGYLYLFTVLLVAIVLMPAAAVMRGLLDGVRVSWRAVADPSHTVKVNT